MGLASGGVGYLRMIVNGTFPDDYEEVYGNALKALSFLPLDPTTEQQEAYGWVAWDDALSSDFSNGPALLAGDNMLLRMRIDTLKIPATTLKAHVEHRVKQLAQEQGRGKLTRNERSQVTADTKRSLRQQSLAKMALVEAQWSMATGEIRLLGTAQRTVALFIDLFEKTFALKLEVMGPRNLLMMRGMTDEDLNSLAASEPDQLHLRVNAPPSVRAAVEAGS
jgi:hypothetical protein